MSRMDPAWKSCFEADDRANKTYEKAVAQAEKDWEKAIAPATEALNAAIALAWNACQEAKTKNFETYAPQGPIWKPREEARNSE